MTIAALVMVEAMISVVITVAGMISVMIMAEAIMVVGIGNSQYEHQIIQGVRG